VVFTLVTTDFGIPKIIGGNFGVLSTDVYKQVVGQQNFQMGAVVGVVLLTPTVIAFALDRLLQRRHTAMFSSRSVPYVPTPSALDWPAFIYCCAISLVILVVFGVAGWASFIKFWPYDFSMSLANYDFKNFDVLGWQPYFNSILLALLVTGVGTGAVFFGAYLVEKATTLRGIRAIIQALAIMPVAIPGLVLGLGYIFFFNNPNNPASYFYGGVAIMVVNTIVHFYTVPHLTALTALKRLDREFELISDSLRASRLMTFRRVTLPLCGPVLLDVAIYFFVNAMTTVAAIIFLYNSDTKTAAIAVINLDDSGMPSAAIAMGMMIFYTCVAVKLLQLWTERALAGRMQRWMRR
jgi:iron(III) transport system permease protein